jgi:DUF1680 family protein
MRKIRLTRTASPLLNLMLPAASLLLATSAPCWQPPTPAENGHATLLGHWAAAQARNADRMAEPPLDDPAFILDDVSLKQHRKFAEYSGDISGRWIGAAAFLATRYPQSFAALPTLLDGFAQYQKADGHFGAVQDFAHIERKRDMPILWGNGRLLIGLIEVYDCTRNPGALAMAKKMGDYFVNTSSIYNDPENISKIGGNYADGFVTCYFSCLEGMAGLARVTRDRRYLEEAKRIAQLALSVTNFDTLHSHGRLCAVRGFVDLHALTGETHWLGGAERDWEIFTNQYLLPIGGVKGTLGEKSIRGEGCAVAGWLRLNLSLWQATGKARYLDMAERTLKNHFAYQQFPNGGAGHRRLRQVAGQPVAFEALSEEAWWCCGEHWARALVDVARGAVAAGPNAIYVNLAIDCETKLQTGECSWNVALHETDEALGVKLQPAAPSSVAVYIHRPGWASNARINTPRGIKSEAHPDCWKLTGKWQGQPEVRVEWQPTIRAEGTVAGEGVLLQANDLLVAGPTTANSWFTNNLPAARPVVLWSEGLRLKNGSLRLPASILPNPDPLKPDQWRTLELVSLRSQALIEDHKFAWFSFQPSQIKPKQLSSLLRSLPQ